MFKNFIFKSLIKSKLKGVPDAEIEKLLAIVEKNPEFFHKVAEEVDKKTKAGMGQEEAVVAVLQSQQNELKKIMN